VETLLLIDSHIYREDTDRAENKQDWKKTSITREEEKIKTSTEKVFQVGGVVNHQSINQSVIKKSIKTSITQNRVSNKSHRRLMKPALKRPRSPNADGVVSLHAQNRVRVCHGFGFSSCFIIANRAG
jgi:hypothetical protein